MGTKATRTEHCLWITTKGCCEGASLDLCDAKGDNSRDIIDEMGSSSREGGGSTLIGPEMGKHRGGVMAVVQK